MKYSIVIALLMMSGFYATAQPPADDKAAVRQVIELYFDGWGTGDTTKVGQAMHATCHLKFFRNGVFSDITRHDYLARFKPRAKPEGLVTRLVTLDITENIAAAKTEIDTGTDVFTDYFNLVKTNEGWFIVDKVSVRVAKTPQQKQ